MSNHLLYVIVVEAVRARIFAQRIFVLRYWCYTSPSFRQHQHLFCYFSVSPPSDYLLKIHPARWLPLAQVSTTAAQLRILRRWACDFPSNRWMRFFNSIPEDDEETLRAWFSVAKPSQHCWRLLFSSVALNTAIGRGSEEKNRTQKGQSSRSRPLVDS